MALNFSVGLTGDFRGPDGRVVYRDIGLDVLEGAAGVSVRHLAEHRPELGPDQLAGLQGVIVLTPRVTAHSLSAAGDLLAVGRFGVGYDSRGRGRLHRGRGRALHRRGGRGPLGRRGDRGLVARPDPPRPGQGCPRPHRPMARPHRLYGERAAWPDAGDHRPGRDRPRARPVARGFRHGSAPGVRSLRGPGGRRPAGRAAGLAPRPAGLGRLRLDPLPAHRADPGADRRARAGTDEADGVPAQHGPRRHRGRGRAGRGAARPADRRGGRRLLRRGAGHAAPPLGEFENVLLAPHCIAWTDELFRDIGRAVCRGMLDLSRGLRPHGVVNPEVFDRPGFRAKWARLAPGGSP